MRSKALKLADCLESRNLTDWVCDTAARELRLMYDQLGVAITLLQDYDEDFWLVYGNRYSTIEIQHEQINLLISVLTQLVYRPTESTVDWAKQVLKDFE